MPPESPVSTELYEESNRPGLAASTTSAATPRPRAGAATAGEAAPIAPDASADRNRGWVGRLLWVLGMGEAPRTAGPVPSRTPATSRPRSRAGRDFRSGRSAAIGPEPSGGEIRSMTVQLIGDDRYVFVLLEEAADVIDDREAAGAWKAIDAQMALIPGGVVPVVESSGALVPCELPAFYLDRYAVTNRQFQRFIRAGGYDKMELWPKEVWPSLMKFTDRTGKPGPRHWEQSAFPSGKADHPVVGISWFEALAYSRWVGKRLPTAAEWQKAGGWPEQLSGGGCNRYPWGDIFDPRRANLFSSGRGGTVAVHEYPEGSTPNGIYQMSGNVWEWLNEPLDAIPCEPPARLEAWTPLRRIVGGGFDTYFPAEATCQFITGQAELDRRANIGFRCCDQRRPAPHPRLNRVRLAHDRDPFLRIPFGSELIDASSPP